MIRIIVQLFLLKLDKSMRFLRHHHFYFLFVSLFLLLGFFCALRGGSRAEGVAAEAEHIPSDSVQTVADLSSGYRGCGCWGRNSCPGDIGPDEGDSGTDFKAHGIRGVLQCRDEDPELGVVRHLTAVHTDGPILRKDYDFTNDDSDSGCEKI